jgi:hypothetical protein
MQRIQLPERCAHDAARAMVAGLAQPLSEIDLHVTDKLFIRPGGLALICSWALLQQHYGSIISLSGDEKILRYLGRMDFHSVLGLPSPKLSRRPEEGRFMSLRLLKAEEDILEITQQLCDMMIKRFDRGALFVPTLEWIAYELMDNIQMHAETPIPGLVCSQFYPSANELEIAIVDMGRGVRASLAQSYLCRSHEEAIKLAIAPGVTRDKSLGQGNGLAGTIDIAEQNEARYFLWTGNCQLVGVGSRQRYVAVSELPGTGLVLRFNTSRELDLSKTRIVKSDSLLNWNYLASEADKAESDGIKVSRECSGAATRQSGLALRRKIRALLDQVQGAIAIDFSNVSVASSSFLDESLGKLIAEIGVLEFQQRIKVIEMSPLVRELSNKVIDSRMVSKSLSDSVAPEGAAVETDLPLAVLIPDSAQLTPAEKAWRDALTLDFAVLRDDVVDFGIDFVPNLQSKPTEQQSNKVSLCDAFGIPLLRVDSAYLKVIEKQTLVGWMAKIWYFYQAWQAAGNDEDSFAYSFMFRVTATGKLENDLELDPFYSARLELQKMKLSLRVDLAVDEYDNCIACAAIPLPEIGKHGVGIGICHASRLWPPCADDVAMDIALFNAIEHVKRIRAGATTAADATTLALITKKYKFESILG